METVSAPITELLRLTTEGDRDAREYLFRVIFGQLRRIAAGRLNREKGRSGLEPTELVHEAYIQLFGERERVFQNRVHFLAVAAQAMHYVLIDLARKRKSVKRNWGSNRVDLGDAIPDNSCKWSETLLQFEEVLQRLGAFDKQGMQVVELKVFLGATDEEIAAIIGKSSRTVKRDFRSAKEWLVLELSTPAQSTKAHRA
jgi:RNA polymerase sigma factor (TIGR02999 family)